MPLEVEQLRATDKGPWSKGPLPPGEASLVEIAPENVIVSSLKAAEDGQGLIVRVHETAGAATEGTLTLPLLTIVSAQEANAVEVPGKQLTTDGHTIRFRVAAHQTTTIRMATR
jgi:alpha-mannosidase